VSENDNFHSVGTTKVAVGVGL